VRGINTQEVISEVEDLSEPVNLLYMCHGHCSGAGKGIRNPDPRDTEI